MFIYTCTFVSSIYTQIITNRLMDEWHREKELRSDYIPDINPRRKNPNMLILKGNKNHRQKLFILHCMLLCSTNHCFFASSSFFPVIRDRYLYIYIYTYTHAHTQIYPHTHILYIYILSFDGNTFLGPHLKNQKHETGQMVSKTNV